MVSRLHSADLLGILGSFTSLRALSASRENNCNLVRFAAASLVVASHSFALAGHPAYEPIARLLRIFDGGSLAVLTFFSLSGYLVAQSWATRPSWLAFCEARALRIFPALFVVSVLTVLVIGPIATQLRPGAYFASIPTREYVPCTIALLQSCAVPGVFASNPIPHAANGSLWTISVEVACYACVVLVGVLGLATHRFLLVIVIAMLALAETLSTNAVIGWFPHSNAIVTSRLVGAFACGALFFVFGRWIPLSRLVLAGFVLLVGATFGTVLFAHALIVAICYAVLYVAFAPSMQVRWFPKRIDVSYGLYLVAFPIQQLLVSALRVERPVVLFVLAYPLALALAWLCWEFVERRCLALKGKLFEPSRYAPRGTG